MRERKPLNIKELITLIEMYEELMRRLGCEL